MKTRLTALVAAAALCSTLGLKACSNSEEDSTEKTNTASTVSATAKSTEKSTVKETETEKTTKTTTKKEAAGSELSAETFHLHDGFVKAVPADKGMTAVFGTLENHTDADVHLVGFTANLDASVFEVHEVVNGVMQQKEGGIVIPAGGQHVLKPGADHLMIMQLKQAVEAGDKVEVTLEFEGGKTVKLPPVPVRQIGAGDEDYGDMGHDHGSGDYHGEHKDGMEGMKHDADEKMDEMKHDAGEKMDEMKDSAEGDKKA